MNRPLVLSPQMARRAVFTAFLVVLSFVLHLTLARQFDRVHAFDQIDVLFDADISTRLEAISGGRHLGIKHPNLMAYFTPPIALGAKILIGLGLATGPEPELRRTLGTVAVPAASALKTAVVFSLFHALGFSWAEAAVATLLATVSFSNLIFGSIPESYGFSSLAFAFAYAFAAGPGPELTWRRSAVWVAIGVFAMGITLVNVVFVALLLWAAAWDTTRFVAGTLRVAAIVATIVGVTAVSAYVFDLVLVRPEVSGASSRASVLDRVTEPLQHELTSYAAPDPGRKLRRFPTSVSNTFVPPAVDRVPLRFHRRHELGFTLENSPDIFTLEDPLGLLIFCLLIIGTVYSLATPSLRSLAVASIGMLAACWLLTTWGRETYLYSQQWHLAALVLIAGVMRAHRLGRLTIGLLGALTLVIAIHNLLLLRAMIAILASVP